MSTTFIIALILAVVIVANLRFFLLIAAAVLLALIITGIGAIAGALEDDGPDPTVLAPVPSGSEGSSPGGPSDNLPEAPLESPR
jgi:hypothetical protein